MAKESGWHLASVSRWRRKKPVGMPMDSLAAARAWRAVHAPERAKRGKRGKRVESCFAAAPPPTDWVMSPSDTRECMEILKGLFAEGAGQPGHAKHQSFCDGIRLVEERGF